MKKTYVLLLGLLLASGYGCVSEYPTYPGEDQMEQNASDDSDASADAPSDGTDSDANPTDDTPADDPAPDPFAGKVTYLGNVAPILNQLCVACHNASIKEDGVDLSSYVLARQQIEDILESMTEDEDEDDLMPPSGRVDNSIIQTLLAWRGDGLLEGEVPPEDPGSGSTDGTYTYTGDILTLFEDYCIMCHGPNAPAGGFDMSTYQKTVDQIDIILTRMELAAGQAGVMPPAGPLTAAQMQQIRDWVDQGMPE